MKSLNQCYMKSKSLLETDIFNYKTPEFYINMKYIPDKKSSERKAFVLEEKRKCKEGLNINGIHIPGSLYFHLNYYHLQGDDLKTGRKAVFLPRLRDNEWVIFNDYEQAFLKKLIYTLLGARQIAKSEIETSLCLREICLFKETEAMALFSGQPDKDTFVKKMSTAITHGESFMIIPNIDKDWGKDEIRFGFTKPDNTTELRARLYIYNTQDGKRIQVGSGKSVSFLLMDEIAKSDFRAVYDTIEPALLSDIGTLRCSPILAFTGGETEKARDAKNLVENPVTSKQFTTVIDNNKTIGGRFMSGLYRKDCKEETTFSKFIGKETGTWLDNYPIHISDFEKAAAKIEEEKQDALKSPDKSTFTLKRIFFPLTLDDVFLTESNNKFPIEVINQHKEWLTNHYEPNYVDLFRDKLGKVQWKHSLKRPLRKFPVKPEDDKDSCLEIYEFPIQDAPRYTYCIGIDPVNADESSANIVSLFSVCVYKRMISPLDEFKNQVVASIAYRPKELSEAHEMAIMLAEFYNAVGGVLPEASENSIFQYFYLKKKGHFLADSFDLNKEINFKTKFKGKKGLPPTTANQKHYMGLLIEDANKEVISMNDEGDEFTTYGVTLEHDIMLLEEYKEYKSHTSGRGVHNGNYDRVISRGCAETLARFYDIKFPITQMPKSTEHVERNTSNFLATPFGNIPLNRNNKVSFSKNLSSPTMPRWMKR